jgi:hypothetical protein
MMVKNEKLISNEEEKKKKKKNQREEKGIIWVYLLAVCSIFTTTNFIPEIQWRRLQMTTTRTKWLAPKKWIRQQRHTIIMQANNREKKRRKEWKEEDNLIIDDRGQHVIKE